jgi:hypothetical protein
MMRRFRLFAIQLLILWTVPSVAPARADPILITAGSVTVTGVPGAESGIADLHGTQGFQADVVMELAFAPGPWQCQPCGAPGTLLQLAGFMDTLDGLGTIVLGGISYGVGTVGGSPGEGVLALSLFSDQIVLPPLSPSAVLSAPFELQSDQSRVSVTDANGQDTSLPLRGRGTLTLELTPNESGEPVWEFAGASYEFEPIPEPTTLLLFGTGALGLAARHRRLVLRRSHGGARRETPETTTS